MNWKLFDYIFPCRNTYLIYLSFILELVILANYYNNLISYKYFIFKFVLLKVDRISTSVSDMGRAGVPPPTSVSSSGSVTGRMTLRPYHPPQQTIYP